MVESFLTQQKGTPNWKDKKTRFPEKQREGKKNLTFFQSAESGPKISPKQLQTTAGKFVSGVPMGTKHRLSWQPGFPGATLTSSILRWIDPVFNTLPWDCVVFLHDPMRCQGKHFGLVTC